MDKINNTVFNILGICYRAGKLVAGNNMAEDTIRSGRARLVIISEQASDNTLKKFTQLCNIKGVDFIKFGEKRMLGQCIGKSERTVMAITDINFKRLILNYLNNNQI